MPAVNGVFKEEWHISSNPVNIARVTAAYVRGGEAVRSCVVEVAVQNGIGIHLVGLADEAVKETLLRVVTALQSLGYEIPGKKVIINLVPSDLRKSGAGFDLPIAVGLLLASEQVSFITPGVFFHGELGLDGSLRLTGREDDILDEIPMDHVLIGATPVGGENPERYMGFKSLREFIDYAQANWARR